MSTNLVLVGADKGGVGKTTVARALLDYLHSKGVSDRPVDTETGGGLVRFRPDAPVIDVADVRGQMQILDGVSDKSVTVVDIRAGQLSPTVQALKDTGMLTEARNGLLKLVVLHVVGNTSAAVAEIEKIMQDVPSSAHVLVRNRIQPDSVWPHLGTLPVMDVPHLPEAAAEAVDKAAQTFLAFTTDQDNSRVLRGYVRHWLDQVWAEFDRNKVAG